MEGIYAIATSSSSVTYGNVANFIKEMLINNFPYNFFKYKSITSEIAYRNIRRQLGNNSLDEMVKREKPWLVIRPRFDVPSGDTYLYDIPLTKNFDNMEYGVDKRTLFPLLHDTQSNYKINYRLNRDLLQFEVTLTLPTLTSQIDIYKYMTNHLVWDRPYTQVTSLEAMIPRDFVNFIGKMTNVDITDPDTGKNMIPIMIQQLNKFSRYPITYKMRNATSLDEFFMYYDTELLITLTDISIEDATKKNMMDESYNINFRVNIEFNLPGSFFLTGTDPTAGQVYLQIKETTPSTGLMEYISIYTLNNLYGKYNSVIDNFRLIVSSIFKTETDQKTKQDTLDISVFFNDVYTKVINESYKYNSSVDSLVKVIIVKDSAELVENTDWSINWNNKVVTINNSDDDATYRILVYVNSILMNDEIINAVETNTKDKSTI